MRGSDIAAANDETLQAIREGRPAGTYRGFVDVAIPGCPPFVMFTNDDCSVAGVCLTRDFEPASLRLWCKLARSATGVLDIGAFTGIYALAAASIRPDLSVYAYEPNPYSMSRLRVNRSANALWNIEDQLCAVGHRPGQVRLNWLRKKEGVLVTTATLATRPGVPESALEHAIVEVRALDDSAFCAQLGSRPLVKIDVEGTEALVMKGLTRLLQQTPDILIESFSADACEAINALILPLGYQVFFIDEDERRIVQRPRMQPCDPRSSSMNQWLTTRADAARIFES